MTRQLAGCIVIATAVMLMMAACTSAPVPIAPAVPTVEAVLATNAPSTAIPTVQPPTPLPPTQAPPTSIPSPPPVKAAATPATAPPTAAPGKTATSLAPPKPKVALSAEVPVGAVADVVGVWLVKFIDNAGDGHLEFTPGGTYTIQGVSGAAQGATVDSGKFTVEGGRLTLDPDGGCLDPKGTSVDPCLGTYEVYVARQGDRSAQLRFVVEEDKSWDRTLTFNKKVLSRAEP
jgi:hypothetical protein